MVTRRIILRSALGGGALLLKNSTYPLETLANLQLDRLTLNHGAATVHPLATQSAMRVLQEGGNAIDAAISAALVLGVVDGHNSGIGGGCLALIRRSNGSLLAIDGRETAGDAATQDMFVRDGKPDPRLSQTGPLACGVPGQIAAMHHMHSSAGRFPWKLLFQDAIHAADVGVPASKSIARTVATEAENLAKFPASREIYLRNDRSPIREGEFLVQKDLAETLTRLSVDGPNWFYQGPFAKRCADYLSTIGGILTQADFNAYRSKERTPLRTRYREWEVVGFPPPSSGGIHIAQMLTMLEPFPVGEWMRERPADYFHLLAEVMKRAFADRAHWLGDSDFVSIPNGLLDLEYSRDRMKDFILASATQAIQHGMPPGADTSQKPAEQPRVPPAGEERKHTTHLTVADLEGNWVALTSTVNTSWGCKVTVPGTGVMLNNQMDDFSISPGTPNAFGLVGSQANAVEPRKRPLSSMSPTIVLDPQGIPVLTVGAAGGPRIINATLQILLRCLDGNLSVSQAVAAPRIHQQWRPDETLFEKEIGQGTELEISNAIQQSLRQRGHSLKPSGALAVAQAIQRRGNKIMAAHDPRSHGSSAF